jgi:hypothetical protein
MSAILRGFSAIQQEMKEADWITANRRAHRDLRSGANSTGFHNGNPGESSLDLNMQYSPLVPPQVAPADAS